MKTRAFILWLLMGFKVNRDVVEYMDAFYRIGLITGFLLGLIAAMVGVMIWAAVVS